MYEPCEKSVSGMHSPLDVHGVCAFCERKVAKTVCPPKTSHLSTERELFYGYYYDPDFDGELKERNAQYKS